MNAAGGRTRLCISVAAKPGTLGTRLHNAGYRALGLDYVYVALAVENIEGAMRGVRALGVRGCSVSMPFKVSVMSHLDVLDDTASRIGAVNTVVNDRGVLTGYNTDAVGARQAIASLAVTSSDRVLILGAGGVARAILYALSVAGVSSVLVASRSRQRVAALSSIGPACRFVDWPEREAQGATVAINATPIGMHPSVEDCPIGERGLESCRAVFDTVANLPETELIRQARGMGKLVVEGVRMSLHQAAAQFALYTGREAPMEVFETTLATALSERAPRA